VSSVSPDRGEQESTVPITITGANFTSDYYPTGQAELAVSVSRVGYSDTPAGVTVENLVVVNSTTLTCDLVISQTALIGLRNVMVSHTGGDTNNEVFMVGYPSDFLVFFS
jgi:hypothetical protein